MRTSNQTIFQKLYYIQIRKDTILKDKALRKYCINEVYDFKNEEISEDIKEELLMSLPTESIPENNFYIYKYSLKSTSKENYLNIVYAEADYHLY